MANMMSCSRNYENVSPYLAKQQPTSRCGMKENMSKIACCPQREHNTLCAPCGGIHAPCTKPLFFSFHSNRSILSAQEPFSELGIPFVFKLVFPPWAWHLLLRPTKPHAPPSTSPHCHPHSRRDNSAQSWTLLNPKNVVSRDHCAAVPAAPSVTTTTRVVRVVHGRGHPRSR